MDGLHEAAQSKFGSVCSAVLSSSLRLREMEFCVENGRNHLGAMQLNLCGSVLGFSVLLYSQQAFELIVAHTVKSLHELF